MYTILLFVLVKYFSCATFHCQGTNEYVSPNTGVCYGIFLNGTEQQAAEEACIAWQPQKTTHLLSIHSQTELDWILTNCMAPHAIGDMWYGLMKKEATHNCSDDSFYWLDGSPVDFLTTQICDESVMCLRLNTGGWYDRKCDYLFAYGCSYKIPNCFGTIGSSTSVCSGVGTCISDDICSCDSGCGVDCSVSESVTCSSISCTSPTVCSSHGACTNTDECSCFPMWEGTNCNTPKKCFSVDFNDVGNVCSGNGVCKDVDNCACDVGYVGNMCQNKITCDNIEFDDPSVCNNGRDRCYCVAGTTGMYCENCATCPGTDGGNWCYLDTENACSGRAACVCTSFGCELDTFYCDTCQIGYSGIGCIDYYCNQIHWNASGVCSDNGVCESADHCSCVDQYYGSGCAEYLPSNIITNYSNIIGGYFQFPYEVSLSLLSSTIRNSSFFNCEDRFVVSGFDFNNSTCTCKWLFHSNLNITKSLGVKMSYGQTDTLRNTDVIVLKMLTDSSNESMYFYGFEPVDMDTAVDPSLGNDTGVVGDDTGNSLVGAFPWWSLGVVFGVILLCCCVLVLIAATVFVILFIIRRKNDGVESEEHADKELMGGVDEIVVEEKIKKPVSPIAAVFAAKSKKEIAKPKSFHSPIVKMKKPSSSLSPIARDKMSDDKGHLSDDDEAAKRDLEKLEKKMQKEKEKREKKERKEREKQEKKERKERERREKMERKEREKLEKKERKEREKLKEAKLIENTDVKTKEIFPGAKAFLGTYKGKPVFVRNYPNYAQDRFMFFQRDFQTFSKCIHECQAKCIAFFAPPKVAIVSQVIDNIVDPMDTSLKNFIENQENERLTLLEKYRICVDILDYLHTIHENEYYHGDLSLENIYLNKKKRPVVWYGMNKVKGANLVNFYHIDPEELKRVKQEDPESRVKLREGHRERLKKLREAQQQQEKKEQNGESDEMSGETIAKLKFKKGRYDVYSFGYLFYSLLTEDLDPFDEGDELGNSAIGDQIAENPDMMPSFGKSNIVFPYWCVDLVKRCLNKNRDVERPSPLELKETICRIIEETDDKDLGKNPVMLTEDTQTERMALYSGISELTDWGKDSDDEDEMTEAEKKSKALFGDNGQKGKKGMGAYEKILERKRQERREKLEKEKDFSLHSIE